MGGDAHVREPDQRAERNRPCASGWRGAPALRPDQFFGSAFPGLCSPEVTSSVVGPPCLKLAARRGVELGLELRPLPARAPRLITGSDPETDAGARFPVGARRPLGSTPNSGACRRRPV